MNYKELEFLRRHTFLNPIKKYKVLALRDDAEQYAYMMEEYENCHLGIDYSKADELEYSYRIQAWNKACFYFWMEYGNGEELDDYAKGLMHRVIGEKENKLVRNKTM